MINEKGLYGMFSGVLTAAVLQPFENIKMALMLPPKQLLLRGGFLNKIVQSVRYINMSQGVSGYYKGLSPALLKVSTGCYFYFSILRQFNADTQTASRNFAISSGARIISTFLTNPLSVIETRFELPDLHPYQNIREAVRDIYKRQGASGFFSGGLASCMKEGVFGGFYYMIYEEMKSMGFSRVFSGLSAGVMATTLTHPLEVVRAKLQIQGLTEHPDVFKHLIIKELKQLRESGDLFRGLAPRLIKKPIANSLTFILFEITEEVMGEKKG